MKKYHLRQYEATKGGINGHNLWVDEISLQEIHSNNDVLGNKYYMTDGETSNTIWYKTPTEAIKAFLTCGKKAISK